MRDLNDDDDRLRSLPARQSLSGFGRLATDEELTYATLASEEGDGAVAYSQPVRAAADVLSDAGGTTSPLPANAVPVVQPLSLPQFNFGTGIASCNTCASDAGTTSSAVATTATAATAAKVTPLPEAPQPTNYLLWALGLGVAFLAFRGPASGLGCPDNIPAPAPAPAPAPTSVLNGLPPRRREHKALKHVSTLKIN